MKLPLFLKTKLVLLLLFPILLFGLGKKDSFSRFNEIEARLEHHAQASSEFEIRVLSKLLMAALSCEFLR